MTKAAMEKMVGELVESWIVGNVNIVLDRVLDAESTKLAAFLAVEIYSRLLREDKADAAAAFRYAIYGRAVG